MPRVRRNAKPDVPAAPTVITAMVNCVPTEVPLGKVLVDPVVLRGLEAEQAYGIVAMLRHGSLNPVFVPVLFPRIDGMFALVQLTRKS